MPRPDAEPAPPSAEAAGETLLDHGNGPARHEFDLAALASIAVGTNAARSRREIADAALAFLCDAIGAASGLIVLTDRHEAVGWRGLSNDVVTELTRLGVPDPTLITALATPDRVLFAELAGLPVTPEVQTVLAKGGLSQCLLGGLWAAGRLFGILLLGWRTRPEIQPSNSAIIQAAALVGGAIDNARLTEAVEEGLAHQRSLTTRLELLVELTRMQVDTSDAAAIAEDLLQRIMFVLGAAGGWVVQVDGSRLRTLASHETNPGLERLQVERPASEWGFVKRFSKGAPAYLESITEASVSTVTFREASRAGYRAFSAFPIRDGLRLDAVLIAVFRQSAAELPIDERTLQGIGRVIDISFANQRLRSIAVASEERYRALFERSPDALIVHSLDDIVVDANPKARELYGEDIVGAHASKLAEIEADVAMSPHQPVDTRGATRRTGIGRRHDGATFPVEIEATRIQIDGVERILDRVRDTTERDRLQQELLQAQKMEAIGLLVAGVAHELNNPLASILAFSQLIRTDRSLPPELHGQADMLIQEARRTHRIVKGLLDFARQRPPERLPTSLRAVVDEVLGLQSYTFGPSRIEAIVDIPDEIPLIPIDRAQIQQVLVNLTLNAGQAILSRSERGTIRIVATPATTDDGDEVVRLSITDDGPGIPPELLSRLFVPFFSTKAPGEGTGLGLSVSFGIVAGHGGSLRHEAGPGGVGTTFVVELPVAPRQPDDLRSFALPRPESMGRIELAAAAPRGDAGVPEPGQTTAPRVLVLDDEASIRDFLARILRRNGYEPVPAIDGAAAIEIVRSDPPRAILCDHRMAGMSGIAFHEAVEAIDPNLARRFAFMSGDVLNPELHDFAVARGIVLLAKPFDIETVAKTVADLTAID